MLQGTQIQNSAQGKPFLRQPHSRNLDSHNRKLNKLSPNHLSRNPKLINRSPNPLSLFKP